jgi:hypothetical protein
LRGEEKKKKKKKKKKGDGSVVKLGILGFILGRLPMNNKILIFSIILSVILSVIFNLNFKFNQKFLETAKYHRRLFNPSVILSVKNSN